MGDYYGHSVLDGVLQYGSVSSVKMFDPNTKAGCPRRWAYRYVHGLKEAESENSRVAKDKGIKLDAQLKNYLRTGDKAVSSLALKGLHILETPGSDLATDVKLHTVTRTLNGIVLPPRVSDDERDPEGVVIKITSSLTAAGLPFVGEVDYAHARGHYRDDDGQFQPDPPNTIEVCDIKFKTYAKDRQGNSTFMHEADLVRDIQMAGYGEHFRRTEPGLEHIRLSHLYYPENGGFPTKVTRLHVVQDVIPTWNYVDAVVHTMKDVAAEKDIEKVPYQAASCHAYNVPCAHTKYCRAHERSSMDSLYAKIASDVKKEPDVGLLAANPQIMNAPAPQPDMRAQLAAEEQQMRQQVVAAQKPTLVEMCAKLTSFGFGMPTLGGNLAQAYAAAGGQAIAPGTQYNSIAARPGSRRSLHTITLTEVGHLYQLAAELDAEAAQAAPTPAPVYVAPPPAPVAAPSSFLSPDAPASHPNLAMQHQSAPTPQAEPQPASSPPAFATQTLVVQVPSAPAPEATRRGRPKKPKDVAPGAVATTAAPSPSPVATPVSQAAPEQPSPSTGPSAPSAPTPVTGNAAGSGIVLINARIEGRNTKSLAGYVDYINEKLARMYNTTKDGRPGPLDVRMAVEGSILGFGGWKGAVRTAVKAEPPPEGDYHLDTYFGEINEIVAGALSEVAEQKGWLVVRGIR